MCDVYQTSLSRSPYESLPIAILGQLSNPG